MASRPYRTSSKDDQWPCRFQQADSVSVSLRQSPWTRENAEKSTNIVTVAIRSDPVSEDQGGFSTSERKKLAQPASADFAT